jgi:hypothetical protein
MELSNVVGAPTAPARKLSVVSSFAEARWKTPTVSQPPALESARGLFSVFLPPRSSCCFTPRFSAPSPNALPGPLRTWSSCRAEKAWWVNYSMAVANRYSDSLLSWVRVFSWPPYAMVRCWSPHWSSVAPIVSSYAARLGAPCTTLEVRPYGAVSTSIAHL